MLLIVGQIGRPHGIRGEVIVHVRTDEPEQRFTVGSTFVVEPTVAGLPGIFTIDTVRPHMGRMLVNFAEVPDRNTAEAVKGLILQVDSATIAPPEDPEEFHDHQLVGLAVVTVERPDRAAEEIGKVTGIDHAPSSDLLVVRLADGRTGLVPFVSAIVPKVDVAGGRVLIDPPDGLFDL